MRFHKNLVALFLVLPLAILPAACSDKNDRDKAQDEELDRDLNLALKGDSTQGIFEDTTQGLARSNARSAHRDNDGSGRLGLRGYAERNVVDRQEPSW